MNLKNTYIWRWLRIMYQWSERQINFQRRKPFIKGVSGILVNRQQGGVII